MVPLQDAGKGTGPMWVRSPLMASAGRAATKLHDFADEGCLDDHLPATLDLLVLENLAALSGGQKVHSVCHASCLRPSSS